MPSQATSLRPAIESKIRRSLPKLYAWYRKNCRPLPWRTRPTPYPTAVAEFMCQQTRIATVIPYYLRWMRTFPDWSSLARSSPSRVLRLWEGLGYYRRARFLHSLAKAVIRLPGKELPTDPAELRKLPGIGDYTAGAIASIAFDQPAPAFDGNVARVLGRLAARAGRTPQLATLRSLAGRLVPRCHPGLHNQALMELGALICLPKHPCCSACPLRGVCSSVHNLPRQDRARPKVVHLQENILIAQKPGMVWLAKTDSWGRWSGLWTLPTLRRKIPGRFLFRWLYPYTKYRFEASVISILHPPPDIPGKWRTITQLEKAALPAPHRQILQKLELP